MNQNSLLKIAEFLPKSVEPPNAWVGHLPFAAWVIQQVAPKIFVELGTHSGNSYFAFCQAVAESGISTKCYAVDTWQGDEHAGQYGDDVFIKVNAHNQEHYSGFSRLLRMTFDDALNYFVDESIELLHIDGMHTYEAVRHDFETWLPKLAPGAVVIFHDTNVRERNFGVWKLWGELQDAYPNNMEFVHSHGLGVLQLNNTTDSKKLEWLQSGSTDKQKLVNYFAALGLRQLERYEFVQTSTLHANQLANLNQTYLESEEQITDLGHKLVERDGQIATFQEEITSKSNDVANLHQIIAEREKKIIELNQAVVELDNVIKIINKSFLWRVTRPIQSVINKLQPLRIFVRRAIKLMWWILTLQIGKKFREWRMSRNVSDIARPHFSPPTDDYSLKVPFEYAIEKGSITPTIAVVCHMYYPDLLEEFKRYLANIPFSFDLFITTDTEHKKNEIVNGLLDWDKGAVDVRLAPNRGRDIAPKLISCRDVYDSYEFFLHIHSKKSPHFDLLAGWRSYLLDTLLGSEEIVKSIFEAFKSDPKLGMVAPEHFGVVRPSIGWGWNFKAAKQFAVRLGINLSLSGKIDFPSGSMFWARSEAIKPLLECNLTVNDFPPEDSQIDGTLGHVIERLYYFVCERAGFHWLKIVRPVLAHDVSRVVLVKNQDSLNEIIKNVQYGLLDSAEETANLKQKMAPTAHRWHNVYARSNMGGMEFSQFCHELEKHILKQKSAIDFDEDFYYAANPDVAQAAARGDVPCGYIHYCLTGQYEGRIYSDLRIKERLGIGSSFGQGLFYPESLRLQQNLNKTIDLSKLPENSQHTLLILFSHLQEELFFAGYSEFFKDHIPVFEQFDQVVIAVKSSPIDKKIVLRYSKKIEVISFSELSALKHKPDIIIGFNAHLTCEAYRMLPDMPERVVYYCQDFESGFFPYGNDYIIGEKAISDSHNLIVSTELLRQFLQKRDLLNNIKQLYVTRPKIEVLEVQKEKTNRLFFYFRPESFHKRNLPEILLNTVNEFCQKYSGFEIYMVGSVATSYSFKINGTQVYVVSKLPKKDYVELISSCDVVVTMIYSAHPGVIAFQAAASGIPTVTNVFENRDAVVLKNISENIVPYDPVSQSLLMAIEQALAMPKGRASFDETIYSGNQEGSLDSFYNNILRHDY